MPDIPQFKLPLQLAPNGDLQTIEQDTDQELAQRVTVLCVTPPGTLPTARGFGLADQTFRRGGPDTREIERQIAEHVPDALALVETDLSALDDALARVGVKVGARP
jgi:hypothetical protein